MEGLQKLEGYVRRHIGKQVCWMLGVQAVVGAGRSDAAVAGGECGANMAMQAWQCRHPHSTVNQGICTQMYWASLPPSLVCLQVRLRLTPEIRFVQDDSIERSERIFKLLDQVSAGAGCWVLGAGWGTGRGSTRTKLLVRVWRIALAAASLLFPARGCQQTATPLPAIRLSAVLKPPPPLPAVQVKKIERGEAEPPPLAFYGEVPEHEEEWEEEEEDEGALALSECAVSGSLQQRCVFVLHGHRPWRLVLTWEHTAWRSNACCVSQGALPAALELYRHMSCAATCLPALQATSRPWTSACLAALRRRRSSVQQRPAHRQQQQRQRHPAAAPSSSSSRRAGSGAASRSRRHGSGRAVRTRSRLGAKRRRRSLRRCCRLSSGRWSSAAGACERGLPCGMICTA